MIVWKSDRLFFLLQVLPEKQRTRKAGETMQGQTEYQLKTTIQLPGMTARVFSPVLTAEERNKRLNRIHNASAELLKNYKK